MKRGQKSGWKKMSLGPGPANSPFTAPEPAQPPEFELECQRLGLTAEQAADNPAMQLWIKKHYWKKFVPEPILQYLGFNPESMLRLFDGYTANLFIHKPDRHGQSSLQRDSP